MAAKKKRTSYTRAKAKRVTELREGGETLTALASRYKTTVPTIRRWIEKYNGASSNGAAPPKRKAKVKRNIIAGANIALDRAALDLTNDEQFRWLCFGIQRGIINPS